MPTARRPRSDLPGHLLTTRTVISGASASGSGLRYALRQGVADGTLVAVLPRVYAATPLASAPDIRLAAASTWSAPYGGLAGVAAAYAWGVIDRIPRRPEIALPPRVHREHPDWLSVTRSAAPYSLTYARNLRVVDRDNAMVQAWNSCAPDRAIEVVVASVQRQVTVAHRVRDAAAATPRVRERAKLMELLGHLEGGAHSYLEWLAKTEVFTHQRFPHLEWQVEFVIDGRSRFPDIYDRAARIAIELDSRAHHSNDADRRADIKRDAEFAALGIQILRFTYEDIARRGAWCLRIYQSARASRLGTDHPANR